MTAYNDILKRVEQLRPSEQLRLIEDLAALVRQQVPMTEQVPSQTLSTINLERWFGFLAQPIDALEFQLRLRQEWDREIENEL